jgi:hypothetical protein
MQQEAYSGDEECCGSESGLHGDFGKGKKVMYTREKSYQVEDSDGFSKLSGRKETAPARIFYTFPTLFSINRLTTWAIS